jgi:hypothetical protein
MDIGLNAHHVLGEIKLPALQGSITQRQLPFYNGRCPRFPNMATPLEPVAAPVPETQQQLVPRITLSRADTTDIVDLPLSELIAYSGHAGYTRLNLVGRKVLDVRETTAEIDRLVREASQRHVSSGSSASVGLAA